MYRNLEAELARNGITKTNVAAELGLTLGTLSLKLNGKSNLTLPEAIKIKTIIGGNLSLEYLFQVNEEIKN